MSGCCVSMSQHISLANLGVVPSSIPESGGHPGLLRQDCNNVLTEFNDGCQAYITRDLPTYYRYGYFDYLST